MKNKKYSCQLDRPSIEAIYSIIEAMLAKEYTTDDDKLLMCVLAQVRHKLYIKLDTVIGKCKVSFLPAEAFALRILSTDFVTNRTSAIGNKLHQMANDIHRQFQ